MNGALRLGMLIPEFPSQTHAFFWREIQALREMGVTVELISTRMPSLDSCRHDFANEARQQTHYLYPPRIADAGSSLLHPAGLLRAIGYARDLRDVPFPKRGRYAAMSLLAGALKKFSREKKLQHIHCHSCADSAHIVAMCHRMGGPSYSLTLHGELSIYGTNHQLKMKDAAFVATVTAPLREQVVGTIGVPASRVPVLWMGVDCDSFADRNQRSYPAGRMHMVTVARLNLMKGHKYALEAMRLAVDQGLDLHYTVAGDGPYHDEIAADVKRLNLSDRVDLPGTMSEAAVTELLQRADAFVLPSLLEAAPVSVMEAMSCSLPVICTIVGGTPDMITDGVDGILVPPKDVDALLQAMIRLAGDPDERRRMGAAARQRAIEAFDCRSTARQLLNEIGKHGGPRPTFTEEHAIASSSIPSAPDR